MIIHVYTHTIGMTVSATVRKTDTCMCVCFFKSKFKKYQISRSKQLVNLFQEISFIKHNIYVFEIPVICDKKYSVQDLCIHLLFQESFHMGVCWEIRSHSFSDS